MVLVVCRGLIKLMCDKCIPAPTCNICKCFVPTTYLRHIRTYFLTMFEITCLHLSKGEVCPLELAPGQVGPGEISSAQVGILEVDVPQVEAGQVGTLQVHPLRRKPSTISVRLDFLKCVQIFIFFKTQFPTESVSRFSRQ